MHEISSLAETFEARSKKHAQSIDERVKRALSEHESALRQCLSDEQKRIENATRAHSRRMARIVARTWIAAALAVAATIAAASGVLWWQATEIADRQQTLAQLPDTALSRCSGRLCVRIATDTPAYGQNSQYRIIAE